MKSLWILLAGALSVVIVAEWFLPAQEPPVPAFNKPKAAGVDRGDLLAQASRTDDFPPIEQYQSVKDRPLFFEGRRPPAEYTPEKADTKIQNPGRKSPPPQANLSAVITVGDNTYAIFQQTGKEKGMLRARVGEVMDGWTIESIRDDSVVLKNGKEEHEIPLRSYQPVLLPKPKQAARSGKDKIRATTRTKAVPVRRVKKNKKEGD